MSHELSHEIMRLVIFKLLKKQLCIIVVELTSLKVYHTAFKKSPCNRCIYMIETVYQFADKSIRKSREYQT